MKSQWKVLLLALLAGLPLMASVLIARQNSLATRSGTNSVEIEFVKVQSGEFLMGCSEGDGDCHSDEKPAHPVRITKPFEIGKYEVTQAQWQAVMGSNPSAMRGDDRPVESISKGEAEKFLRRLNVRSDGYRYRLPTEAEWEYAARAGSSKAFAGKLEEIAWYAGNSEDESHPVGKKKPNAWGLYDMQGNVREWVQDFYASGYYSNSPTDDPAGPPAGARGGRGPAGGPPRGGPSRGRGGPGGGRGQLPVMRGGAWDNLETFIRVSSRYNYYGDTLRVSDVGFRAVRERIAQ